MDAYDKNFENEVDTALAMAEAPGRRVLIIGVSAGAAHSSEDVAVAGVVTSAMTKGASKVDIEFFLLGLRKEAARLEGLIGFG